MSKPSAYTTKRRRLRDEAAGPKPEVCPICLSARHRLVWDHCHKRGHFRGWICDQCNRILGLVRDDPEILRRMMNYLVHDRYRNPGP